MLSTVSSDSAVRRSDTVYPAELNDRSLGALNQSAAVADTVMLSPVKSALLTPRVGLGGGMHSCDLTYH